MNFMFSARYPPYSERKMRQLKMLIAKSPIDGINWSKTFSYLMAFVLGIVTMFTIGVAMK